MVHDSSDLMAREAGTAMSAPKSVTLNFIRQFARTCVSLQGCDLGSVILN